MTSTPEAADLALWSAQIPEELRSDPLWRMEAYRLALFLANLAWTDVSRLSRDCRTRAVAAQ
jgi:hypothetical protein